MLVAFCTLEIIKYFLAENICFGERVKDCKFLLLGVLLYVLLIQIPHMPYIVKVLALYVITMMTVLASIQGKAGERLKHLTILFLVMTVPFGIIQFIYNFYTWSIGKKSSMIEYLLCDLLVFLILVAAICMKHMLSRTAKDRIRALIQGKMTIMILVAAFFILFTISLLNYSKEFISDNRYYFMSTMVSGLAYMCIGFLGIVAIYIKFNDDHIKEIARAEIQFNEMQKKYYEALLEKEQETRAYRHDMVNHLLCLSAFAKDNDLASLTRYLEELQGKMAEIQGKAYHTGNDILDAITNYYIPQLPVDIQVTVQGMLHLSKDKAKLCTIYANLIQNAVEELCANDNEEGFLHIYFRQKEDSVRICVENSIVRKDGQTLTTRKRDKRNHGIGLKNVSSAVHELGGDLVINHNDERFQIIVILPKIDRLRS